MIDLHTHILPGVDDGAEDMNTALEMLTIAVESGVEAVTLTPHCNVPGYYENYAGPEILRRFQQLRREAKAVELPVKLFFGMEIMMTPEVPRILEQGKLYSLNGSRYLLVEFAFDEDPAFASQMLRKLTAMGICPVVAHPERYPFVQRNPALAWKWCTGGCALQANKGSFLGAFGTGAKQTAESLLRHGLLAAVASDAHDTYGRTPSFTRLRRYLTERMGENYTGLLLHENPKRILTGKELLGYAPIPYDIDDEDGERK